MQERWFPEQPDTDKSEWLPSPLVLQAQATALQCIAALYSTAPRPQKERNEQEQAGIIFEALLGVIPRFVTEARRKFIYVPVGHTHIHTCCPLRLL